MSNDDVIALLRAQNQRRFSPETLDALESRTRRYLAAAGTEVRYCTSRQEKPIDLVADAARAALTRAEIDPDGIDFVIYAGVMRGWLEPSTASAIQAAVGLPRATSFDVLDACAGWLRAVEVAHGFLASGRYRAGLVVNAECGMYRTLLQAELSSPEELEWRLATYTLGEAATATVLTRGDVESEFYVRFFSYPEHHRLCMVPLPYADEFLQTPIEPPPTAHRFFASSGELLRTGARAIIEAFRADRYLSGRQHDIGFGHSASAKAEQLIAAQIGLADIYYPIHARYGNTGSASVPLGMSLAIEEGRLRRGQRVLVVVGAAGISIGFASFEF